MKKKIIKNEISQMRLTNFIFANIVKYIALNLENKFKVLLHKYYQIS